MHAFLRRTSNALSRRLRLLGQAQDGFTIVEVLVSAVMVSLIAGGVMTGLEATGRATSDLRDRSRAQEIAQQDLERMRGMSAVQLQNLNQTRAVTFDGSSVASCTGATDTCFTVTSTGQFLGSGNGKSCGSDQADYVQVVSTVNWGGNNRPPVVEQSIITPPIGGTILVRVPNEFGATGGTAGATVNIDGPDKFSANTDSGGCVVFAGATPGDYTVTASKSGYVDADGNTSVNGRVTATATDTSTVNLKALGQAGLATATFQTTIAGTSCGPPSPPCGGQLAPSLSWSNPGMAAPHTFTPPSPAASIATPQNLFPFTTGSSPGYTNNYGMWAGKCPSDTPPNAPTGTPSYATVTPGGSATPKITLPGMVLNVTYQTTTAKTAVSPTLVKLQDACGQAWNPPVATTRPLTDPLGRLQYPGQPYSSFYIVCAEFNGYRGQTLALNKNFSTANPVTLNIDSRSASNKTPC